MSTEVSVLPESRIVTLLTDFGLLDSFVAEMKAVILSTCPGVTVVDISHQAPKFDIRTGSFILASTVPYFPAGTVHVAVIDPGVGGTRKPIIVESKRGLLVGPDNGLLIPAAQRDGGIIHVYEITNPSLMRPDVSATFHGRDIFAPAAAFLACGRNANEFGPEFKDYVKPSFAEPEIRDNKVRCEAYHVDGFGNVITNLPNSEIQRLGRLGENIRLMVGHRKFSPRLVRTYSDLHGGQIGLIEGSHGFLEIACRERSAASRLRVKSGSVLSLEGA